MFRNLSLLNNVKCALSIGRESLHVIISTYVFGTFLMHNIDRNNGRIEISVGLVSISGKLLQNRAKRPSEPLCFKQKTYGFWETDGMSAVRDQKEKTHRETKEICRQKRSAERPEESTEEVDDGKET